MDSRVYVTFQTCPSFIQAVLGTRKLNHRFMGWAYPSERWWAVAFSSRLKCALKIKPPTFQLTEFS